MPVLTFTMLEIAGEAQNWQNTGELGVDHRQQPQNFLPLYSIYVPWEIDWQNIVFMNMYKAGETNLLPVKLNFTIKYSSFSMTSYWDFLT